MRCDFPIVYRLETTFTDGITLARSNKQYGPKWGIFNLYQIVCIGQPSFFVGGGGVIGAGGYNSAFIPDGGTEQQLMGRLDS